MGECLAQNANPIAIFMAKKEFIAAIPCVLLHQSIDWWSIHQCVGSDLQPKNR